MSGCLSLNIFFNYFYTLLHHSCDKKNCVIVLVCGIRFFVCLLCNSIAGLYYLHTIYLIKILITVLQHI